MSSTIRIGTRESQLAVWQASKVKKMLAAHGIAAELVYIKSEGDIDLKTPLYAMGVQGVFTRSLDSALLNRRIDIAVHSMKDVPTQLPEGIVQSAVLERASYKDLLVYKKPVDFLENKMSIATIATSSIRRKAQWLHRFPHHQIDNLRGNVNTRLAKLAESSWQGAIFAAAGLERINLRPTNSIELDWMLPAPAQGAIMVVCRSEDKLIFDACDLLNDEHTAICTRVERDFLKILMGGCSTPISALANIEHGTLIFKGNIVSTDGRSIATVEEKFDLNNIDQIGAQAAQILLNNGGKSIVSDLQQQKQ